MVPQRSIYPGSLASKVQHAHTILIFWTTKTILLSHVRHAQQWKRAKITWSGHPRRRKKGQRFSTMTSHDVKEKTVQYTGGQKVNRNTSYILDSNKLSTGSFSHKSMVHRKKRKRTSKPQNCAKDIPQLVHALNLLPSFPPPATSKLQPHIFSIKAMVIGKNRQKNS